MKKLLKGKAYTFIAVFLLTGIILSVPAYLFYARIEKMTIAQTNKQAGSLAVALSNFIQNNSDKYENFCSVSDYSDGTFDRDYYDTMTALLQDIKNGTGAKFIYTEKFVPGTGIVHVLGSEDPSSSNYSPPGSIDEISPMKKSAFKKDSGAVSGLSEHKKRGKLISAFAPIKKKDTDQIMGIVGVEFSQDYVNNIIAEIRTIILTTLLISIIIAGTAINLLLAIRYKSINTDYMTNLYNKCYFERCIKCSVRDTLKSGRPFSLMIIDIDNFKTINDRSGHLVGDEVLKKIARSIKENTRDEDLCFRYGGDEFVVILPETTKEQAAAVGERMQSKILSNNLSGEDTTYINISMSIGIAQWEPNMSTDDITARADKAMYASKSKGKNRITLSDNLL
ncbi:MAG: GGDEF domain-containing protein [Synergistaceae bacterium]|nr:GGDEF domain-containing protein [Synergistaceae bacterium]